MIKVITFDLDDTLWDIGTVITKANTLMLAWMQQHAPKFSQTYDHHGIDALRDEIWQQQPQLKHDLSQSRIALIQLGLERCGYRSAANLAQAAFEVYFSAR
ncbi:MAG: HAD family hydrolase, partial [Oceanospirillaceae bacterium]|nr:HAD family hydrolase [Oceanospirillaceae bacterium]